MNRRRFLSKAATGTAALGLAARAGWASAGRPNNKVIVGVAGMRRGQAIARELMRLPDVEIAYVCDTDSARAAQGKKNLEDAGAGNIRAVTDFRRILEDDSVDALIVATPNHWQAPMTIEACAAGKHVYVEKPASHNPREGELMVAAARKHDRAVQMGNQRRSGPVIKRAIGMLHEGVIGRPYYSRGWYANQRGSIGTGEPATPPEELDYDLWQGPAPRRAFRSNTLHYNWHWFWHWGNGEAGNNAVHALDLSRWGLRAGLPTRVGSAGGRYAFKDDQETPDTQLMTFDFEDDMTIVWEGLSCNRFGIEGRNFGVVFHGEGGTLMLSSNGYRLFDENQDEVESDSGPVGGREHLEDFLESIRENKPLELNAEIEDGQKSTLMTHLGNIAYRTGRSLECDPGNGHILNDREAMDKYWSRDYEAGWEPKV